MSSRKPAFIALAFAAGIGAGSLGVQLQRMTVSAGEAPASAMPVAHGSEMSDTGVIGQRRPDFALPDPDGRMRSPSEWDGKVLVVNFWATWCPPCLEEMPAFKALQERYGPDGVQFLGIALDDADNVRRFIAELGLNYPSVYGQGDAMQVASAYGNRIGALPLMALNGGDKWL